MVYPFRPLSSSPVKRLQEKRHGLQLAPARSCAAGCTDGSGNQGKVRSTYEQIVEEVLSVDATLALALAVQRLAAHCQLADAIWLCCAQLAAHCQLAGGAQLAGCRAGCRVRYTAASC